MLQSVNCQSRKEDIYCALHGQKERVIYITQETLFLTPKQKCVSVGEYQHILVRNKQKYGLAL